MRGRAGARVPGRHQPPHHRLEAERLGLRGQAEDGGVEAGGDVGGRGLGAGVPGGRPPHRDYAGLRVTANVLLTFIILILIAVLSSIALVTIT